MDRRDLRDLRPLRGPGHRELRADREEVVLNLREEVPGSPVALGGHREADHRIEFVDGPHRLDSRVILRDAFRPEETGLTGVPATGVELRHQPTRAPAPAAAGLGQTSCCTMRARISNPSTSLGPDRVK